MAKVAPGYIQTAAGDYISKEAALYGIQHVTLLGKSRIDPKVVLRGDHNRAGTNRSITVGTYCHFESNVNINPPSKTTNGVFSYYPVRIGDHVRVGKDTIVEAALVGSCVDIGSNCHIGAFCIIKDCVKVLDGTIIAPLTVVASFSIYGMVDDEKYGRYVGEWSESSQQLMEDTSRANYHKFIAGN